MSTIFNIKFVYNKEEIYTKNVYLPRVGDNISSYGIDWFLDIKYGIRTKTLTVDSVTVFYNDDMSSADYFEVVLK